MSPLDLFQRPGLLLLLVLAPFCWWGLRLLDRHARRRLDAAAGAQGTLLLPAAGGGRSLAACVAGGLALALLALAEPAWGSGGAVPTPRGADLVVCLDVSRSMRARDIVPDRLGAALDAVERLARRAEGDRLALVVFAGEARLMVPLTADRETFLALARTADPTAVDLGGTDLGAALETALGALPRDGLGEAAIILLTDGEDHGGRGTVAARGCAAAGVAVHAVGLGSPSGSRITTQGARGEEFQVDRQGRPVLSTLDEEGLRALSGAGGGTYRRATAGSSPLVDLYEGHVLPLARRDHEEEQKRSRTPRHPWALLGALVLWSLVPWLRAR